MIEFLMVPGAPTPVAPFSHAVAADGWLFVTGQMPTFPGDDSAPLPEGIEAQTRRVVDNLKLVLAGAGAYGFGMGSNYNSKPLAAEVLVTASRIAAFCIDLKNIFASAQVCIRARRDSASIWSRTT